MDEASKQIKILTPKRVIFISFVVVFSLVSIGYGFFKQYNFNKLKKEAANYFENGNYSAALLLYDDLKEANPRDPELDSKARQAKDFFIAEETFKKAREAAANGDWRDVEILLKNSQAIALPEFKYYQETLELYQKARGLVDSFEKELSEKISSLKQSILEEKNKRRRIEQSNSQLETQLRQAISKKEQTAQQLQSAQNLLKESQDKITETQSQLELEQSRAKELALEAEKQRLEKFVNELAVYVDMLKRGNDYLNSALAEIDKSSDVTAFVFIGYARDIFDEVAKKANDLLLDRTPTGFTAKVEEAIESANLFDQAVKSLRNAVIYIDSKGSEEFTNNLNEGKNLKMRAYGLVSQLTDFINSS
jgi:flagellar biosynthesis GTPase FlhF